MILHDLLAFMHRQIATLISLCPAELREKLGVFRIPRIHPSMAWHGMTNERYEYIESPGETRRHSTIKASPLRLV